MENPQFLDGFPIKLPLNLGFSIATFDYQRVCLAFDQTWEPLGFPKLEDPKWSNAIGESLLRQTKGDWGYLEIIQSSEAHTCFSRHERNVAVNQ